MARTFALGVIILCVGAQLRVVETFVLNEKATKVVNERLAKRAQSAAAAATVQDPFFAPVPPAISQPKKRAIKPPRWLAYSFLSIGAILICTCPLRR